MNEMELLEALRGHDEYCMGCAECRLLQSDLWVLHGHGFCGAETNKGTPCTQWVADPADRCYMHRVA